MKTIPFKKLLTEGSDTRIVKDIAKDAVQAVDL